MAARVRKFAIFCHRWMGVAFCLLFAWWFISGIFMMYTDFPEVSPADRLKHSPPIDPAQVRISPADAWAKLRRPQEPAAVTLGTFDNRPVYRFSGAGGGRGSRGRAGAGQLMVYADDGSVQTEFTEDLLLRLARQWAGTHSSPKVEPVTAPDQWTVQGGMRNLRTLRKYSFTDGQQLYINTANGTVMQYTTTSSRILAYLGPIAHWLYFTPLRVQQKLWTNIVIWTSGVGTTMALLGLIVGLSLFSPSKRYRHWGAPSGIPYYGSKRLHMTLGLFFGIVTCTWAFSGMLSMDPFPAQEEKPAGESLRRVLSALRPGPLDLADFTAKPPTDALSALSGSRVKQLDFTSFDGEPLYMATLDSGETRIVPIAGAPRAEFDHYRIVDAVMRAVSPSNLAEAGLLTRYDRYYLDRTRERRLPVILVGIDDSIHSRIYIDPRTARVVAAHSDESSWVDRWLYHGLHSLNFPWLYNHRPAWDIVVLVLMLGGLTLCITSVILACQLLRRKIVG